MTSPYTSDDLRTEAARQPAALTYGPTGYRCGCGKDAHSNLVPCQPDAPRELTPEAVSAIVRDMDDPRYPSRITVFCDHCGTEFTGEFMVSAEMSSAERLGVARRHLAETDGWEHTEDGDDFCPEHASPDAAAAAGESGSNR